MKMDFERDLDLVVLIPTTGRSTLVALADSIMSDAAASGIRVRIVLALNGAVLHLPTHRNIEIIELAKFPIGVSKAMNSALEKLSKCVVWTIADDEFWLPGKFKSDLETLQMVGWDAIILPRAIFVDQMGVVVRPRKPLQENQTVASYLFGKLHLGRNPSYISLSGAVALLDVWRKIRFPEDMSIREDIEYLIRHESKGTRLIHNPKTTVKIHVDLNRAHEREIEDGIDALLDWTRNRLLPRERRNFFAITWQKPLAATGDYSTILFNYRELRKGYWNEFSFFDRMCVSILAFYWFIFALTQRFRIFLKTICKSTK
jgi:hypothetical protein